jgi:hypothetical protein
MPQPFLAMIIPVGSGGGAEPPLGIWGPTDPRPAHPVAGYPWPQPPLGMWGPNDPRPTHPIAPGGPPLGTWGGAGQPFPTPPMAPGGPPLGIWGGGNVPMPVPPIYFPPADGGLPPYPSQGPGFPTHPIALPPDLPPTMPSPDNRPIEWKSGWTQATGWVVVGVPSGPHPTPSAT